jgi:hypothetical protein
MHVVVSGFRPRSPCETKGTVKAVASIVAAATLLAAGCGASSKPKVASELTTTVPGYGEYPAATVSGSFSPRECRRDAAAFGNDAVQFVAHWGSQGAYPADLYYVIVREVFADFEARRCDPILLGRVLNRRLTAQQRRALIDDLPRGMTRIVQEGLRRSNT